MQRHIYSSLMIALIIALTGGKTFSQKVGVLTPNPQAPLHIASSGQVNTAGGLVVLGDTSEGHLEMDFDILQAMYGDNPLLLQLQPGGGDLRVGSNLLHVNSTTGFVGIGTTSPDQKLDIEGSADQYLRIHTTSAGSSAAGIDLLRSSEFSGTDWRIVNDGGQLDFFETADNFLTDGTVRMTLTQGGFLGIGTDDPESRLHVSGSTDQFLKVHRTTGGAGMAGVDLLRDVGASGSDWRIVNNGGVLQFRDGVDNFSTAGEVNLVMTQSGNVGIGTEDPHTVLHVNGSEGVGETGDGYFQVGNGDGTHLRFDNNEILARSADNPSPLYLQYWSGNLYLCENSSGRVGIGNIAPAAKLHITDGTDVSLSSGGELVLGPTNAQNLGMDGNEIQARDNGAISPLFLQADGGDLLLAAFETGQVGIGVTSSATMPSDDYLLAVDGKIISEEVRVELSGSWPDYVFEEDYILTPLDQLEDKIEELGHLPGIPSSAQIESDGILLGDMQRAMMEKIEELTLYVIELQKQVEALKSQK